MTLYLPKTEILLNSEKRPHLTQAIAKRPTRWKVLIELALITLKLPEEYTCGSDSDNKQVRHHPVREYEHHIAILEHMYIT